MNAAKILSGGKWMKRAKNILANPELLGKLIRQALSLTRKEGLRDVRETLSTMTAYLKDILNKRYREYSSTDLLLITAAVTYVVSPLDLIPDMLVIVGWTDDISILLFAAHKVGAELERYRNWRAGKDASDETGEIPNHI